MNAPTLQTSPAPPPKKKRRLTRGWWLKQLHTWHWISAAISLTGMLLFALTGVFLNHAELIPATPHVVDRTERLAPSLLRLLRVTPAVAGAPMPPQIAAAVAQAVGIDPSGRPGEWSDAELYVAMPRPGGDAWVSVDRQTGIIKSEVSSQGPIALLNDLHKGRNTGFAWRLFIDVFAAAAMLFTGSGLLLLQFHANHRKKTWPLVGLGLAVPFIVFMLFVH